MHVHPHEHPHPAVSSRDLHPEPASPPLRLDRRTLLRSSALGIGLALLAACTSDEPDSGEDATDGSATTDPAATTGTTTDASSTTTNTSGTDVGDADPAGAVTEPGGFAAFADSVEVSAGGESWIVESNGLPDHPMMVGITNWQQQVPLPQDYSGDNAWQFPMTPEMAAEPISARTGLFRGAIAIAVNGVPIFNALNNRGDDAFLIGELDDFGGHCGRADDYHYHVAPLHLSDAVGPAEPIAWALDGYPIYGSTEPDGGPVEELDEYNGHVGPDGAYHYHGTTTYPYINGGLVGVVEVTDQVEPQPETRAVRPAGEPLAGAVITEFDDLGGGSYLLQFAVDGAPGSVEYTIGDTSVSFTFTGPDGDVVSETFDRP